MDTIDALKTRRSIRRYTDKHVAAEMLERICTAAMYAPSAGNEQPWHFIVVTDGELLAKIPDIHTHAAMAAKAPAAILVCGDLNLESHKGFWVQDCAAATQNLLLAAHAYRLGAVWCGIFPKEDRVMKYRKLFALPDDIVPFALVPVGYPEHATGDRKSVV